jgi:23S rRNA (guanosine2251-2'-O)-methyltransferase
VSSAGRDGDVVYGSRAVTEALRGRRAVLEVLISERRGRDEFAQTGIPTRIVPVAELARIAQTDEHQGVVARVAAYAYADPDQLLTGNRPLLVALDELTDPHNVGAIARSAECAGAAGMVITRHRAAGVTPAVSRVSAGAVEHLPIAVVTNLSDWLVRAKRRNLWVFGLDHDGELDYTAADLRSAAVLVVGSEQRGLRPRVRATCDGLLRIPLAGRIDSLNASVAAAIVLFEAARQRRA